MGKRQQVWVGTALGLLGLLALFGALHVLSGGGDVELDGNQLATAAGGGEAVVEGDDVLGDVTIPGADGQVRSFGSDGSGPAGADASGVALRVVTDESRAGSVGSDAAIDSTSPSSSTAAPTNPTSAASPTAGAGASSSSQTSAAQSTQNAPATASTATTNTPTTANEAASTQLSTTTTAASTSSSTTATTAAPTTRPPTTASDSSPARTFELEVIRLTNEERSAGGCAPLTNNDKLHTAALGHSVDMAENDYFSHTSKDGSSMVDRVERQGYRWRSLAENIAAGYRSPASVVDGWMNSSGHRANIMNCSLTEIGVGFHNNYWTQNFGTPR